MLRVILAVLLLLPSWSGEERLPLWGRHPVLKSRAVALGPAGERRAGRLTYVGGIQLLSSDPGFGGYSALSLQGDRFTLVSDGGLTLGFRLTSQLKPWQPRFGELPDGPGSGWRKLDRDSEGLAIDPATGRAWVSFERYNMIWRYAPDLRRAEGFIQPRAMRDWPLNSGPEAIARLRDGGFLVFSEGEGVRGGGWMALRFAGDPLVDRRYFAFALVTPKGYKPVDAVQLDARRLLVLTRAATLAQGFTNKLLLVDLAAIRPGARVRGAVIATLVAPLVHDNFEGIAVTREAGRPIVWLVSDDNNAWWMQRSLLLKFRLEL